MTTPTPERLGDEALAVLEAKAAYQRDWRARHGAVTGRVGRPASNPCGTPAAFRRHQRNGEVVDDHCRDAWNAYMRYRRDVRQAGDNAVELAAVEARYVAAVAEVDAAQEARLREAKRDRRRSGAGGRRVASSG